jgi:hypothetical protein
MYSSIATTVQVRELAVKTSSVHDVTVLLSHFHSTAERAIQRPLARQNVTTLVTMAYIRRWKDVAPHLLRVLQVSHRVALLCVNEAGEQYRIPHEEYRCIVAHHVPVALLSVELLL